MSPSPVSVDKITRFVVYRWYLASRVICIYEIIHSLCNINVLLIHSHVWNKWLCFYMQTELLWVFYLKQVSAWFIRSFSWRPWNSKRVLGGHVLLDIFNTFIVLLNFFQLDANSITPPQNRKPQTDWQWSDCRRLRCDPIDTRSSGFQ